MRWARLESDSILTREDVRAWRGLLASPASSAEQWRAGNRRLWAERIQPLEQWMAGARRLVVIPSGAMVGIPLEDLEDAQGRCLNDVYEISYTPSATLYAWLKEQPPALGTEAEPIGRGAALLVGDPVFRAAATAPEGNRPSPAGRKSEPSPPSRESEPSPPPRKAEPYPATSIQRGVALTRSWDQDDQRTGDLRQLPWTRAEVEGVARLWPEASVLLGPEASEQALVAMARAGRLSHFRVLHFATHALVDDDRPEASALVLSSVDLSQANSTATDVTATDVTATNATTTDSTAVEASPCDGLVTAQEILREWKLRADLVTLSACASGLGREVLGEGYVGFAHAFLQVGARCLLVSLWPVDDQSTALLMRRFYENWIGAPGAEDANRNSSGMSKAAALREAKAWLRRYAGPSGVRRYTHPYYWAGFILLGDAD